MRGFTLIELLIVLVLVAFVAGVAAPSLISVAERLSFQAQIESLRLAVNELPFKAMSTNTEITIGKADSAVLVDEQHWLVAETPITYSSNGVCSGGLAMILRNGEIAHTVSLSPPFCQWQKEQ